MRCLNSHPAAEIDTLWMGFPPQLTAQAVRYCPLISTSTSASLMILNTLLN
jgi:hypothetical protein